MRLRRERMVSTEVEDGTVLLDLETSTYFVVAGTGTFLLSCLVEGATKERLAELLVEKYEVDLETAKADVAKFLNHLEELQMLEQVS
jgi:Coenzyme PQQ synthesis protein D (PqqD)